MNFIWQVLYFEYIFLVISATFTFRLGPCFEVVKSPGCNRSIPESFTSVTPVYGAYEANTWAYLFTPKNPDKAEALHECGGHLPSNTKYDKDAPTEIFIHGWLDGLCRTAWMREMKDQLYIRGRYNVILIDWTWGNTPDYLVSSSNSKVVGEQLGFIINNIMKEARVGPEKFHIIGQSFGAQSASHAGKMVPDMRRITGLDPALAPYKYAPPEERLTYKDAKIVDIIHTNAGDCFINTKGDPRPTGHADFYPNGGEVQSSCYSYILTSFLKGDIFYAIGLLYPSFCYHLQSIEFYKMSINPKEREFIGVESNSYEDFKKGKNNGNCAIMGMNFENNFQPGSRKKFYLDTTLKCPYVDDSNQGGLIPNNPTCR